MADFGTIDPSIIALINGANVFTNIQKISVDNGTQITFYRPVNTGGFGAGFSYDFNNSSSAEVNYGQQYVSLEDNTAGAHRGDFNVQLAVAASLGIRFRVYTAGNGGILFGNNQRIQLDETGLSAGRIYTFPNASGEQTVNTATQTLTNKTIDADLQDRLINFLTTPSTKQWGECINSPGGLGFFGTLMLASVENGTRTTGTVDSTHGLYSNFASAASTSAKAGVNSSTTIPLFTKRAWNPRFLIKFSIPSLTSTRLLMGFSSNSTIPTSDTLLATTDSGVLFGYRSATDTTFSVFNNDGAGSAMVITASGTTKDTSVHSVEIIFTDSVPNCVVKLDGAIVTTLTTRLPATGTLMTMYSILETTTTSATNLRVYRIEAESDV